MSVNDSILIIHTRITNILQHVCFPVLLLLMRIWMARIFWYSGLIKISSWPATIYLFREEYKVPFIPPEFAAFMATAVELSTPALLITGFMTRFAVIPMLFMTAIIQFTYLETDEHLYWAFLLGTLLLYGPGKLSVDYILKNANHLPRPT